MSSDMCIWKPQFIVPFCWWCLARNTESGVPKITSGMSDEEIADELCLEEGERLAEDLRCWQCGNPIDRDEGFSTIILPAEEVLPLATPPPDRSGRRIGPKLQAYIRMRDRGTCGICGTRLSAEEATAHHIQAYSQGGPTSHVNLVVACERCQQAVADSHLPVRNYVDTELIRELSDSEMQAIVDATMTEADVEALAGSLRIAKGRQLGP